jgi:KaiC/GvpD/RAD55 family RecA-like ATPase
MSVDQERLARINAAAGLSIVEPPPDDVPPPPKRWRRCRDLVSSLMKQAADPSVSLKLGPDTIAEVRPGAIVLLIGASGGGKTSLAATLLVEHAQHVGPAIAMSLELPGEEFTGRVVGIRCDEGWLNVLTGRVAEEHMQAALPDRLIVIERRDASIDALADAIVDMKREYPGEPILVACDYVQLVPSDEREIRRRVADAMARLDGVARDHRVVMLALSQGSRAASRGLTSGELKGAATTDAGAEAAELERWSTMTLAIGPHAPSEDTDTTIAELNVGKSRMGSGDRVFPMRYCGRSGRWRTAGESRPAAEVRAEQEASRASSARSAAELAMIAAAERAPESLTREELKKAAHTSKAIAQAAVEALLGRGDLVEVRQRKPRSPAWRIWTRARAEAAGVAIVEAGQ